MRGRRPFHGGRTRGADTRPAPPVWLIQYGLNRDNIDAVHVGGIWAAKKSGRCRPATCEQALDALRNQGRRACSVGRTRLWASCPVAHEPRPAGWPGAGPAKRCDREGRSPTRRKAMRGFSRTIVLACNR
ncbi:DUF6233 domain-containing protein [Streptomyces sp. NPDC003697]